ARIAEDPKILGLGDVVVRDKERRQHVGGRLDLLLQEAENPRRYEVEIQLGATDESHIIRTIEYWDIERQRRPQWEHRAVIVAEEITARFFNVLRLLNRAIPLIAIKLSAFRIDDRVILHPVTVLNVREESSDPDVLDPIERADRAYWEKKSPSTLIITDKIVSSFRAASIEPRLTYNRNHIAMGTTGYNFCWFYRRKPPTGHVEFRVAEEARDTIMSTFQDVGIDANPRRANVVTFNISISDLEKHLDFIRRELEKAELLSR
ncbi:MAG TPA: hypothetical protein VN685_08515, partial [Rhizomicrobium sp.]|nr:hypothetical protein [Rhizomicrobium sp.]